MDAGPIERIVSVEFIVINNQTNLLCVINEQRNVFTKKSNIATVTYYYGYIIVVLI